ncbi:MAG: hypothetical protein EP333_00155 [Bacteroidetes bacterium]|nr:MAG: hypothetical protein EP333_00155 [Bacteroidota bacterium]
MRKYLSTGFLFPVIFLSLILSGCSYYTLKMVDAEKFIKRESHIRKDIKHDTDLKGQPIHKFKKLYLHESDGKLTECRKLLIVDTSLYFEMSEKKINVQLPEEINRPDQYHYANALHIQLKDSVKLEPGETFITPSDIHKMTYYEMYDSTGQLSTGSKVALNIVVGLVVLIGLFVAIGAAVSTASKDMFGSGCYVATMAYGDVNAPQVELLRKYRDEKLRHHFFGMLFIRFYYTVSPSLVFLLKDAGFVHRFIRRLLDRYVHYLCKKHAW